MCLENKWIFDPVINNRKEEETKTNEQLKICPFCGAKSVTIEKLSIMDFDSQKIYSIENNKTELSSDQKVYYDLMTHRYYRCIHNHKWLEAEASRENVTTIDLILLDKSRTYD